MNNLPTMVASSTSHTAYSSDELFGAAGHGGTAGAMATADMTGTIRRISPTIPLQPPQAKGNAMAAPQRRIVKVYIADTHESVPLADCMLYQSEEKLTDATDTELFFELNIAAILEEHNKKRILVIDRSIKDRVAHLEPVRVRDLKMTVTTVATF